jgi:hypothetical protein
MMGILEEAQPHHRMQAGVHLPRNLATQGIDHIKQTLGRVLEERLQVGEGRENPKVGILFINSGCIEQVWSGGLRSDDVN